MRRRSTPTPSQTSQRGASGGEDSGRRRRRRDVLLGLGTTAAAVTFMAHRSAATAAATSGSTSPSGGLPPLTQSVVPWFRELRDGGAAAIPDAFRPSAATWKLLPDVVRMVTAVVPLSVERRLAVRRIERAVVEERLTAVVDPTAYLDAKTTMTTAGDDDTNGSTTAMLSSAALERPGENGSTTARPAAVRLTLLRSIVAAHAPPSPQATDDEKHHNGINSHQLAVDLWTIQQGCVRRHLSGALHGAHPVSAGLTTAAPTRLPSSSALAAFSVNVVTITARCAMVIFLHVLPMLIDFAVVVLWDEIRWRWQSAGGGLATTTTRTLHPGKGDVGLTASSRHRPSRLSLFRHQLPATTENVVVDEQYSNSGVDSSSTAPLSPYEQQLRHVAADIEAGHVAYFNRVKWHLERMGPAFVKAGQWLCTRPDFFSAAACVSFATLLDGVTTHSWPDTLKVLTETTAMQVRAADSVGASSQIASSTASSSVDARLSTASSSATAMPPPPWPLLSYVSKVDVKPLNSGSMAQVHRATLSQDYRDDATGVHLRSGTDVVLKVIHPGHRDSILLDLKWLSVMLRGVHRVCPSFATSLSLEECGQEYQALLASQLDFSRECDNLLRFRYNFRSDPHTAFPTPLARLCSTDVMVETFEPGIPLSAVPAENGERTVFASLGLNAALKMVFEHNLMHADLHSGNVLARYVSMVSTTTPRRPNPSPHSHDPTKAVGAIVVVGGKPNRETDEDQSNEGDDRILLPAPSLRGGGASSALIVEPHGGNADIESGLAAGGGHGDAEGGVFLMPQIVFLDAGLVTRLSAGDMRVFTALFHALLSGNSEAGCDALLRRCSGSSPVATAAPPVGTSALGTTDHSQQRAVNAVAAAGLRRDLHRLMERRCLLDIDTAPTAPSIASGLSLTAARSSVTRRGSGGGREASGGGHIDRLSHDDEHREATTPTTTDAAGGGEGGGTHLDPDASNWMSATYRVAIATSANVSSKVQSLVEDVAQHGVRAPRVFPIINVGKFLTEVLEAVRDNGVRLDANFTTLLGAIVLCEGLGRQLQPDIDVCGAAWPYLCKALVKDALGLR